MLYTHGRWNFKIFCKYYRCKARMPLSPTLFGLLIDELECMVLDFVGQEGIEEVKIANAVIMLLLYTNDVVLMAHTLEDEKDLMSVLKQFCL